MKKFCVFLACALLFTVAAFSFGACERKGSGLNQKIDPTKTQLYVSSYNGGYGKEWLDSAIRRFEAKYANEHYEEGKTGVQVMVIDGKNVGTSVLSTISSSPAEVFFTEGVYMSDFVSGGYVEDITDIVTEKLTEYGETKSIEEKFTSAQKDYFGVTENGETHYYMIPHYQSFRGFIYDVDLFDEEKLFIAKNGAPSESLQEDGSFGGTYKFTNQSGVKSAGPDGKYGTYDDGMPATYEEFYALCDKLGSKGIVPISYAGSVQVYYDDFLTALEADVEGLTNMMANYNFSGEVDSIIDLETLSDNGSSYDTITKEMSNKDGYLMARVEGKYKALEFTERLIKGGMYGSYFSSYCFDSTSNIENQSKFLYGRYGGEKTIAMIVEGSFWENEADGIFKSMATKYGDQAGRYSRRFAIMPFPKADETRIGERLTIVDSLLSAGFIKSGLPSYKREIAANFLQFVNTDESLREFNVLTGAPKSLEYDLNPEDEGKLSYFGKSVMEMRNDENTDIVYPASSNAIYRSSPASFFSDTEWNAVINGATYSHPQKIMHDRGFTAVQMFRGISNRLTQSAWTNAYGKFF